MADIVPLDCFMQLAATGIGRTLKGTLFFSGHVFKKKMHRHACIIVMSMCSDVVKVLIQTYRT